MGSNNVGELQLCCLTWIHLITPAKLEFPVARFDEIFLPLIIQYRLADFLELSDIVGIEAGGRNLVQIEV